MNYGTRRILIIFLLILTLLLGAASIYFGLGLGDDEGVGNDSISCEGATSTCNNPGGSCELNGVSGQCIRQIANPTTGATPCECVLSIPQQPDDPVGRCCREGGGFVENVPESQCQGSNTFVGSGQCPQPDPVDPPDQFKCCKPDGTTFSSDDPNCTGDCNQGQCVPASQACPQPQPDPTPTEVLCCYAGGTLPAASAAICETEFGGLVVQSAEQCGGDPTPTEVLCCYAGGTLPAASAAICETEFGGLVVQSAEQCGGGSGGEPTPPPTSTGGGTPSIGGGTPSTGGGTPSTGGGTPGGGSTGTVTVSYVCNPLSFQCEQVTGTTGPYSALSTCSLNCQQGARPATNSCGGNCALDADCSVGNSCRNGTCALDSCIADPSSCSSDLCTVTSNSPLINPVGSPVLGGRIPNTSFEFQTVHYLLFGIMIILTGILAYKVNFFLAIGSAYNSIPRIDLSKLKSEKDKNKQFKKDREKFEKKVGG